MIRLSGKIDLKAGRGTRKFSILAYNGGPMKLDGFRLPVVVDLSGVEGDSGFPLLIDHISDASHTLGTIRSVSNDGQQLTLTGVVTGQSELAQEVIAAHDAGQRWQASIGASVIDSYDILSVESVVVNGRTIRGPVTIASKTKLVETSVLPNGADSTTHVNLAAKAAQLKGQSMPTFDEWIKSIGLDAATLSPEATEVLQKQYDAMSEGETQTENNAAARMRREGAIEAARQSELTRVCAGHPHILTAAIANGWSAMEAQNHVYQAKELQVRPTSFKASSATIANDSATLTAGLLIRAGHEGAAVKAYGVQAVEAARHHRVTNLPDLAAAAMRANGLNPDTYDTRDKMIRAAFVSTNLPTILSDAVGRSLEKAYEESSSDWRLFCHVGDAPDFREQTTVRPSALQSLDKMAPDGRMKQAKLAEEDTYSWKLDTFSKMISVNRQVMINDDLNFLQELAPMFGTAAARTLADLIWSTILGGQTAGHFSSGNLNLLTSGSALAVGSLGTGVSNMRKQQDSQGFDLDIRPAVLVVPPSLELTARALLNSAEILGPTDEQTPSGNPVQGIVQNLIVEPRLENTRFTGNSATQWYLFGNPSTRPVTVGFLNGQTTPTVETDDADFDQLGMQMRCFADFAVALADHHAGLKATGAS